MSCLELGKKKEDNLINISNIWIEMYFDTSPPRAGCGTRSIFKQSEDWFIVFYLQDCSIKAKEPSVSCFLSVGSRRKDGSSPFPSVLVWNETQRLFSRIWSLVAYFISYDDNRYAKRTRVKYLCVFLVTDFVFEKNVMNKETLHIGTLFREAKLHSALVMCISLTLITC